MRTFLTLVFSLILWTGTLPSQASETAVAPMADAEAAPSTLATAPQPSCGEAAAPEGDLAYLSFEARPVPFPNECIDCRPCSVQGHCGVWNGYYLGVCSPPGTSYCGYREYNTCTCY